MTLDPLPLTAALWYTRTVSMPPAARGPYLDLCLWTWAHVGTPIPGDESSLARLARCSRAEWRRVADDILPLLATPDGGEHYTDPFVEALRKNPTKQRAGRASAQARRRPPDPLPVPTPPRGWPVENRVENPTNPAEKPGYAVENAEEGDLRTSRTGFRVPSADQTREIPIPIDARARGGSEQTAGPDVAAFVHGILARAPQGQMAIGEFKQAVFQEAQKYPAPDTVVALASSPQSWLRWRDWLAYDEARKRLSLRPR